MDKQTEQNVALALEFNNRVVAGFEKMDANIKHRLANGLCTPKQVKETGTALDMDFEEYCRFQELKSLAVAMGKLTPEEGQTVYACLGNQPSVFNKQPVHIKAVLTSLYKELLEWKVNMN